MKGFTLLILVMMIYVFSGVIVYGDQLTITFPKPYINFARIPYAPGDNVLAMIANFFVWIGNVVMGIIDVIRYVVDIFGYVVNIILMSATFSWIPSPYNWFVSIPVALLFIIALYYSILDIINAFGGANPL